MKKRFREPKSLGTPDVYVKKEKQNDSLEKI
jgi:hypothetical protein